MKWIALVLLFGCSKTMPEAEDMQSSAVADFSATDMAPPEDLLVCRDDMRPPDCQCLPSERCLPGVVPGKYICVECF